MSRKRWVKKCKIKSKKKEEKKRGSDMVLVLSCVWVCNTMDCSPPGSSVYGIFQTRILEWVVISYSRGSSRSRDQTTSPVSPVLAVALSHWGSPQTWRWGVGGALNLRHLPSSVISPQLNYIHPDAWLPRKISWLITFLPFLDVFEDQIVGRVEFSLCSSFISEPPTLSLILQLHHEEGHCSPNKRT